MKSCTFYPCVPVFCFSTIQRSLLAAAALLLFAAGLLGQEQKTPLVEGDYLGLTQFGVVNPRPENIGLSIAIQDSRRFLGILSYIEQENLIVAGTIAKSGRCQIVAESAEAQATIHLDWKNFGGGAATLAGDLSLTIEKETRSGPVVFLRPFTERAIDWKTGRYGATFVSAAGGEPIQATFDITAAARGLLQATIAGWIDPTPDPFLPDPPGWTDPDTNPVMIGTTSTAGGLIAVGVGSGPSQIVTLSGRVTADRDGLPLALDGTYLIEHTTGKLLSLGTFRVLLTR